MPDRLFLSPPHMGSNEQKLVEMAFASNWIAPIGPMIDQFEHDIVELTGMHSAVALSSGTAALHLALRLIELEPGQEVWGSSMTFIGGVAPILYEKGVPVFFDVDPDTLLLDLDLLEQSLVKREESRDPMPRAVISTDLYGTPVDVERMRALASRFGFAWISDTAEAVGSRWGHRHAGWGADFVILSFNGNKIITTSGGGALCCNSSALADRARFLATQARDPAPHYEHSTFGYNYRLSNVCAAIGVGQLQTLVAKVEARRKINATYRRLLADCPGLRFHAEGSRARSNRWLTTLEIDQRSTGCGPTEMRMALEAQNIESRPLWKPMHLQPIFRRAQAIGGDVAADAFVRGLCLPSGSGMSVADIERVTEIMLATIQC